MAGQVVVPFSLDAEALRPIIVAVVAETLKVVRDAEAALPEKLGFSEAEAARLLSLQPHQLRDERLRGKIAASKIVGSRIRYCRADLADYLRERRVNGDG